MASTTTRSGGSRWLHRFAVFAAVATLALLWVGGLVTSHGVGMAVPDWPTSYGYNMFFFPIHQWWAVGGIFYEHSHRLLASGIGFLTILLAVWAWLDERRWLRRLAVGALAAVILQGVLGGLRVTQMKDEIGIFHATLAQLFFALLGAIALFTSRWWEQAGSAKMAIYGARPFRYLFGTVTGLILCQLVLGATMRHQHAGLAIPDFPGAYGAAWPATDPASLAKYNQARGEVVALNPITRGGVLLQMTHRILAFGLLASVAWLASSTRRRFGASSVLARLALLWLALVLVQAGLGAATIWTNKAADVATAHVAVGALCLMLGTLGTLVAARLSPALAADLSPGLSAMETVRRSTAASGAEVAASQAIL